MFASSPLAVSGSCLMPSRKCTVGFKSVLYPEKMLMKVKQNGNDAARKMKTKELKDAKNAERS